MNRFLKILRYTALSVLGLLILITVLVNLSPVQNFIARRVLVSFQEKLQTKIALKNVRLDLFNHVLIEGLYIEDRAHDTLLYAGEARMRITDWFFLRNDKPVITYIGLHDAYFHLYRTSASGDWNYKFIEDAFDTGPSDKTKKQNELEIDLKKIDLQRVRFHMDDAWAGSDMDIDVGSFEVDAKEIDLRKRSININNIDAKNAGIVLRDYEGGRPPRPKKPRTIDSTAFNTGHWAVNINGLSLDECFFKRDAGTETPVAGEFDPEHIDIKDIIIDARSINIIGDTIHGQIKNLAAKERSGIQIKKTRADVTVSPVASICENLYLQTNNSTLQRYYAMHYSRFPDFKDYIHKVVMVADLRNASIDSRDVAYFAPALKKYPAIIKASGSARGTVDNLVAKNLQLHDGTTGVKGDLEMRGLPDIDNTWINYQNGEILTSGQGIFKYAPGLRNNPNLALEQITHAYFNGNFTGYIENFAANGVLATNIGTIRSDVQLKIPDLQQRLAVYSGTVATENFNLGTLLRRNDIGTVSFKSNIKGNAFNPKDARVTIDAVIDHIDFRGYPYRNIAAKGLLEKNKFNGDVLVDDPNLALAFNGIFDFGHDELAINAKANLLKSDLTALKLTKDTMTAAADFDLDWKGNNLDNFLGYAKLYNINLVRNGHRLDLDSIFINSSVANGQKQLIIESNALAATVQGNYQLSTLPASVQAYIAGYLPHYMKAPDKKISEQNFTFEVKTKEIDSLLGVISPAIKGFADATITGSLNTMQQQLSLDAKIPYGTIGNIKMQNISVSSDGNLRLLGINAEADNVIVGDLHGAISVTTTVGNDSMLFNIATTSTGEYGTATINGRAYAGGDTMYLSLLPSEFYLAKARWEIPGGSNFIFSKKYLFIKDLFLRSGEQEISVNSQNELNGQSIVISTNNLNISQLGNLAGLSGYEPSGKLNGTIKVNNLYTNMAVGADLKASDVKLGTDTLGNVVAVGAYEAKKHTLSLDPSSGIYRGNASITAGGRTTFDSSSNQKIDGSVQFNNAPIAWISPFVEGYVSDIGGTLTGTVNVKGTASEPDVDGDVKMSDAHVHIDFLGTSYDIATANIKVNNSEINFGDFTLTDALKNKAIFNGKITHNRFKNLRLAMNVGSSKFQVINLKEFENENFYGNLIAGFQNLSVTGPVNDVRIRITKARPADKSHLYIPIGTTSAGSTYSYVSFKSYDTTAKALPKKNPKNKLNISIEAILNPNAEITLVLDPSTGDAINATGTGNLTMEIPSDDDIRMYGVYNIEQGDYLFTLKQLVFKRKFALDAGSRINFNGLISQTSMNVEGIYTVRARLYDALSPTLKEIVNTNEHEAREAKIQQNINVVLFMKGSLENPTLTFKLDIPDTRAAGTIASEEIRRINQNETELFNHVASLLLIGNFYPQNGNNIGAGATTGAISNVSEVLSGTASSQLTNLVNRLTGNNDLALNVKYNTYSASDLSSTDPVNNRSSLSYGITQNLFNDRLTVEAGGTYDWGKPTANSKSAYFNPVGDFKVQYQFKEGGNTRGYIFRTTNYNAIDNKDSKRAGIGVSWRKSFNTLKELLRGQKYARKKLEAAQKDSAAVPRIGTY